ncbi:hypothetical protein M422DRAFT_255539 [Sphaerobolus stellatus SS14]|uniref:Uncharacterized protein n=1 Tax=Sphaerobolus stellatus (strain SS14) TaxID=990650 RepID=A0A0C9UED0_SPHS4|nr:hypothetical protein M422DRAFT_255539 [Sphaerobolus stellatus SS14]
MALKAVLAMVCSEREKNIDSHRNKNNWIVDWSTDWTDKAVEETVERWRRTDCVCTEEQLYFTAHVLEYVKILHRALIGHGGCAEKHNENLPNGFPILGPVFEPPLISHAHIQPPHMRKSSNNKEKEIKVNDGDANNKKAKDSKAEKSRENFFQPTSEKAKEAKIQKEKAMIEGHKQQLPVGAEPSFYMLELVHILSPVFYPDQVLDKCPVPGCPIANEKEAENSSFSSKSKSKKVSKPRLHKKGFASQGPRNCLWATVEYEAPDTFWKYFEPWQAEDIPHFQERSTCTRELFDILTQFHYLVKLMVASEKSGHQGLLEINPAPSERFLHSVYEFWVEKQCRKESDQYIRTLGSLSISVDTTFKALKKCNIYTADKGKKAISTFNNFQGGLLTLMNKNHEVVGYELLFGNSPLELITPLKEIAERNDKLGVDFRNKGMINVNRCCNVKETVFKALPKIGKSAHWPHLTGELSSALVLTPSQGKGKPTIFRSPIEQAEGMQRLWDKYLGLADVWTKDSQDTFFKQLEHVQKGCLQPRNPELPSHTSPQDNLLLADAILRQNIKAKTTYHTQVPDSETRRFQNAANGSPHLFLCNDILRETEKLMGIMQPQFLDICSKHKFGLVTCDPSLIGITLDRYKKLTSELKQEEDDSWVCLGISLSGDSDGYVDPEALLPPTSPLLQRKRNQGDVDNEAPLPKKAWDSSLEVSENIQESSGSAMELSIDISMNLNEGNILSPVQSAKLSEVINRNEEDIWILKLSILEASTMMNSAPCSPCDNMLAQIIPESSNLMSPSITEETVSFSQPDQEPSMKIEAGSTSHAAVQPSKAIHSIFGSMPSISATAAAKSKRESRTAAYFTAETSTHASDFIKANQIKFGDDCYYRWAALHLQYGWTSTLSNMKWDEIANIYNNPTTVISPYNYNPDFGVPMDPVQRDGALLKVWCIEFEGIVRRWQADQDAKIEISRWKLQQLRILLPKQTSKLVYEKPTRMARKLK